MHGLAFVRILTLGSPLVPAALYHAWSRARLQELDGAAISGADRALALRRVRMASFISSIGLLAGYAAANLAGPHGRSSDAAALAMLVAAFLWTGHAQFKLERRVRELQATSGEALKRALRGFMATVVLLLAYELAYLGTVQAFSAAARFFGAVRGLYA